jgi:DNA-binding NarL/FixJ family response regulator
MKKPSTSRIGPLRDTSRIGPPPGASPTGPQLSARPVSTRPVSTHPASAAGRRAATMPGRRDVASHAPGHGRAYPITGEEVTILRLMANGLPLNSVARHTGLSSRTIRRRLRGLCDRLGVTHPIQAIVWAARRGLV